jgi:predicted DNA binding CopG/RHH family protein
MKNVKLDAFERSIEDAAEKYRPVSDDTKNKINSIIDSARKSKAINIRISEYDLDKLKERSATEGLPYQTLITSVIHKYVTKRLVDEENILKSLQLLHSHR